MSEEINLFKQQMEGNDALIPAEKANPIASMGFQPKTSRKLNQNMLPKTVKNIVGNVSGNASDSFIWATVVAILTCLSVYMPLIRLRYFFDGSRLSAFLYQYLLQGPPSACKNVIDLIVKLLMRLLEQRDKAGRNKEEEYRERKQCKGANDKIEKAPKEPVICLPATISKTEILKRASTLEKVLGQPLTMWMYSSELSQIVDTLRNGFSNLRSILLKAFSLGEETGVDYAGENSFSGTADINLSAMFLSTRGGVDDYMTKKALEGGSVTRQLFCDLGDGNFGAEAVYLTALNQEKQAYLDHMLQYLIDETYVDDHTLHELIPLDSSWLDNSVREWCEERREESKLSRSHALEDFYKRVSVNAFRLAMECYHLFQIENSPAWGEKKPLSEHAIQSHCKYLYRYFADTNLQNLLERWGGAYELIRKNQSEKGEDAPETKHILDYLPQTFTRTELTLTMKQLGFNSKPRKRLYDWKSQGKIEEVAKDTYHKL